MAMQAVSYTTKSMTAEQFFQTYEKLAQNHSDHVLLESGRDGNLSIVGIDPLIIFQANQENCLDVTRRNDVQEVWEGDTLELLTSFAETYEMARIPELPDFQGGLIGFISYDYVRQYEPLPNTAKADLRVPDLHFYLFDEWVIYSHLEGKAYFVVLSDHDLHAKKLATKWEEIIAKEENQKKDSSQSNFSTDDKQARDVSMTEAQFKEKVERIQQYIEVGDVTQVNLTVRQSEQLQIAPMDFYAMLRTVNPSPYMVFLQSPDFSIVSSSPELLVKKRGDELNTRPIGGTRPRGKDAEEDQKHEADLLADQKEMDEHKILVDVECADFAKVCTPESVETNEYMVVEKYSHVMHLVSNVRGTVAKGKSNADIIKHVFPGGSITGAPKLRTMEIIEELEPVRRGVYTGSVGWFGFNGDFEFNIIIRTAFIQDNTVHIQAGAGIIADSVSEKEYVESLDKAKALWQAIEQLK